MVHMSFRGITAAKEKDIERQMENGMETIRLFGVSYSPSST